MAQTDYNNKIPSVIAQEILDSDCSDEDISDDELTPCVEVNRNISSPHEEKELTLPADDEQIKDMSSVLTGDEKVTSTSPAPSVEKNISLIHDDELQNESSAHNMSSGDIKSPINSLSNDNGCILLPEEHNSSIELPNVHALNRKTSSDDSNTSEENILPQVNEIKVDELSDKEDGHKSSLSDKEDGRKSSLSDFDIKNEITHGALIHEEMLIADSDEDEVSGSESNTANEKEGSSIDQTNAPVKTEPVNGTSAGSVLVNGEQLCSTAKVENDAVSLKKKKKSQKQTKKGTPNNTERIRRGITDNDESVPEGWQRLLVKRLAGVSAGKVDVYYISPLGKKLRSTREVISYCEKMSIDIDFTKFHFNQASLAVHGSSMSKNSGVIKKRKISAINKDGVPEDCLSLPKRMKLSPSTTKKSKLGKSDGSVKVKLASAKSSNQSDVSSPAFCPKMSKGLLRHKETDWEPPTSPFNLYQEKLYKKPWQLLIATIFFCKTSGDDELGRNVLEEFFENWPTPESLLAGDENLITDCIKPLGFYDKRVKVLLQFTDEYLNTNWTYPKELHGIGKYGNDNYRVFCVNEWRKVKTTDYLLSFYVDWLWDNQAFLNLK